MTFTCLICGEETEWGEACAHQQEHVDARIEIYANRLLLDLTSDFPRFLLTRENM